MKYSVIIPVFNTADYLPRCMDSLLCQRTDGWEVILVDDGSTDGVSPALCDRYADENPSFVRVIHRPNGGLGAARNTGIEASTGDYLLFLDSDDFLMPDALRKLSEHAEESRADMVVFRFVYCMEDGTRIPAEELPSDVPTGTAITLEAVPELLWDAPMSWLHLCRKSLFRENGIAFPPGVWYEDLESTPKLLLQAGSILQTDDVLYGYFQREGSIMRSRDLSRSLELLDVLESVLRYYEQNGALARYRPYLCVMCASHCIEAARRVLMQNPKAPYLPEFTAFLRKRFPEYRKNPLMSRLGLKKQILLRLLEGGHYTVARRILAAAGIVKRAVAL